MHRSSGPNDKDDLDRRIAEAEAQHAPAAPSANAGEGAGMALGIEFTGAVLVASFIGWGVDHFAGTSPWGLIVGMVLGFCTGIYSLIKASSAKAADGREE